MENEERFKGYVDKMLKEYPQYKNEVNNFKTYLKENSLQEKVFNLNVNHIDEYFDYCIERKKIGSQPTLVTHISALKSLFRFLISKEEVDFKLLYGYIDTTDYNTKLEDKLAKSLKKQIIDSELLKSILYKMDKYIQTNIRREFKGVNDKKRFLSVLVSRLYIKISLIIPLKTSEIINLDVGNVGNEKKRSVIYNNIEIKIPNSIRLQIKETIEYIERSCNTKYSKEEKLFQFLYKNIRNKANSSIVNEELIKAYEELQIEEMLEKRGGWIRNKSLYPPETYKIKAINNMLENGTDIVCLKKLTGLDINSLLANYDIEKNHNYIDIVSSKINSGIVNSDYYTYL